MNDWRDPIHPGEHLADELEEIGINGNQLAKRLNVPPNRISQIINGKRAITADTAMRLGRFFGTGAVIWMNLQQKYDLEIARKKASDDFKKIKPYKTHKQKTPQRAGLNL